MEQSKTIQILVAAGLYPPDIGGPATYAAMIERALPLQGVEVTVIPYARVRNIPTILRHIAYTWRLWRASQGVSLIYALDPVSVGLPALFVSKLRRKPLLLRLGGDYAWEQGVLRCGLQDTLDVYSLSRDKAPLFVRLLHLIQVYVAKHAVVVVVPSEYLGRIVATWGVTHTNIVVIYSALSPLPVTQTREVIRAQLGVSGTVIVTAGRLTPWKGVDVLLATVARLRASGIDVTLVVAGDGPERSALEKRASELELGRHVRFLGAVSKEALGNVLQAADVFLLNTAYEGLSHQLLEVMAANVPIVTTNVGGNPELIVHDVSGLLVDYNDESGMAHALEALLNQPELKARFIKNANATLAKFSETATLKQFYNIINTHVPR